MYFELWILIGEFYMVVNFFIVQYASSTENVFVPNYLFYKLLL